MNLVLQSILLPTTKNVRNCSVNAKNPGDCQHKTYLKGYNDID